MLEDQLKSENRRRDVPLLPPLAECLPKNRVGLLFPGHDGGFMRASEIQTMCRFFCRETGLNEVVYDDDGKPVEPLPITSHCLRHSLATICYEAKRTVGDRLGFFYCVKIKNRWKQICVGSVFVLQHEITKNHRGTQIVETPEALGAQEFYVGSCENLWKMKIWNDLKLL